MLLSLLYTFYSKAHLHVGLSPCMIFHVSLQVHLQLVTTRLNFMLFIRDRAYNINKAYIFKICIKKDLIGSYNHVMFVPHN